MKANFNAHDHTAKYFLRASIFATGAVSPVTPGCLCEQSPSIQKEGTSPISSNKSVF